MLYSLDSCFRVLKMQIFNDFYHKIIEHKDDPLFKNSYYLIGNTLITAAVGFVFWIIAARLYPPEDIGISSAIISAMSLISIFSLLGLDISVIRYLPEQIDKNSLINTFYTVTLAITLLLSILFLMGLNIWAPDLMILRYNMGFGLMFIILTMFFSIFTLQLSVFIGFRNVRYSFFQSFINIVKIILLPLLVMFGAFGIFVSFGLFYAIAFLAGNIFIRRFFHGYSFMLSIKKSILKNMVSYSFENYIANIFYSMPHFLLPIIVLNVLGPVTNAYFYISWTFSSILLTIPFAVSRSLLAEGSTNPNRIKKNIFKSLKFTFIILGLASIFIIIFGRLILGLFGTGYSSNAFDILIVLSLASFPFTIVQLFASLKRIQKDIKPVIMVNVGVGVITIFFGYLMMQYLGLIGVGYAWIIANILVSVYIILKYRRSIFRD